MPRIPTRAFRLSDRYMEWLTRHGRTASEQLRQDLDALRALYEAAEQRSDQSLVGAVNMIRSLQADGLWKQPDVGSE